MKISRIPQKQALETIQVANLSIPKHQRTKHEHLKEIENPDLAEKKNELFNETMLDEEAEEA